VLRRILLATALVAASMTVAVPIASAGPARTQQCPTSDGSDVGVKVSRSDVPVTVAVTDTRTGSAVDVVVTFTDNGTRFALTAPDSETYTVIEASWCVKSATLTTSPLYGTDVVGGTPATNRKGTDQKIGYVTLYSVLTNAACYEADNDQFVDLRVTMPLGKFGNATYFESNDGTCTTPLKEEITWSVVKASTMSEAESACGALETPSGAQTESLRSFGFSTIPADWWGCFAG
jgi:hypothetical protein